MSENTTQSNVSHSGSTYFDRYEFIQDSPGLAITTIVLLSIASIAGTFGNFVILIVVSKTKEMHQIQSVFIVNLAISDMYVTMIADPMSIVGKIEGRPFFDQYPLICKIVGKVCTISCVTSLGSIAYLSINRYIHICHNSLYTRIFTRWTSIVMCLSLYVIGMVLVFLNYAGIGDHSFDDKSLECIWDRMATYSYTVIFSVCLVWIPLLVVGVSYLKLFLYVRQKRKKVLSTENAKKHINRSLKLSRTIFIVYAIFSLCWIPFAVLLVADKNDSFSHEIHLCITVFAHFHPSVNWLIYYLTNTNFKNGLHRIFNLDKKGPPKNESSDRNRTTPSVTPTHSFNQNLHDNANHIECSSLNPIRVWDLKQDSSHDQRTVCSETKNKPVKTSSDTSSEMQQRQFSPNV